MNAAPRSAARRLPVPRGPAYRPRGMSPPRRGAFAAIAAVGLFAIVAFVALGVDLGMISLTRSRLQQTADAAALAAAQEISASLEAAEDVAAIDDLDLYTASAARAMAERVAELNGIYVDPDRDVRLGRRTPQANGGYAVVWGAAPHNAVEVTVRRDNPDHAAPDSEVPAFFSRVFGHSGQALVARATAYVEPRDLVLVLDYSGSMNYDSTHLGFDHLAESEVRANMLDVYNALGMPDLADFPSTPRYITLSENVGYGVHLDVTFNGDAVLDSNASLHSAYVKDEYGYWRYHSLGGVKEATVSGWFGAAREVLVRRRYGSGSASGWSSSVRYDFDTVREHLGFEGVTYPFDGGSWDEYLTLAYTGDLGRSHQFGRENFANYVALYRPRHTETQTLWKAPVYPFEAMKNGTSLLLDFVKELEWGDHVGLVSYDTSARWETAEYDAAEGIDVDISADPITTRYDDLDTIQRHRNGGYYQATTGIGDGISEARRMLAEHGRYGARPTILVMTDGNANVSPDDWALPDDWDWDEITDFDGDGTADYTTDDVHKQYAFYQTREAIHSDYTVHTLTVGASADAALLNAIARAAGGHHVDVPGGSSIADMEADLTAAFAEFAARVPPPRLLLDRPDGT